MVFECEDCFHPVLPEADSAVFSLLRAAVTILVMVLFCKLGVYSVVRRFQPSPGRQKANGKNHPCSCGGSKIRSELRYFQP